MQINNFRLSAVAVIACLFVVACSKDDNDPPKEKTKVEIISSTSWKYSEVGIDQDGNGTKDLDLPSGYVEDCDTDFILTFNSDSTGVVDEGPTKCDTALPQTTPFTWSFKDDETVINFSTAIIAGIGGDAKIIELTEARLTLSKQVTVPGVPIPVTAIVVLVH